jgi:hypothetical protein
MAGVSCGGVFAAPDQEQEPSSTGGEAGAEEDWGAAMRWHTSSASSRMRWLKKENVKWILLKILPSLAHYSFLAACLQL